MPIYRKFILHVLLHGNDGPTSFHIMCTLANSGSRLDLES